MPSGLGTRAYLGITTMPESVTDRPTKAHEYIFLLSKSARYYYDAAAIAEQSITGLIGLQSHLLLLQRINPLLPYLVECRLPARFG